MLLRLKNIVALVPAVCAEKVGENNQAQLIDRQFSDSAGVQRNHRHEPSHEHRTNRPACRDCKILSICDLEVGAATCVERSAATRTLPRTLGTRDRRCSRHERVRSP